MDERTHYQPAIDGLRAVAITPVVLFHAGVPGLSAGYLGVDVFFVLSGFLISRLLLDELQQTGTIDFTNFYARRVRRLLPALATVVATVLVLGTFILSPALERQELSKSAIATMAFVSNFYFWSSQAIYFAPPADWIPLLNMWTLSVEEQFYLLWPVLLMLVAWLGRRSGRSMLGITLLSFFAFFAVSFALFGWGAYASRTAAFYLTPARGWEFALGGALALAGGHLRRISRIGGLAAMLGLVSIAIAITLLHSFSLSVVTAAFGTAAVIAGVTSAPAAAPSRLLQIRPLVIIGKLSYSWYLWHWPLLAFGRILAPDDASLTRTLSVLLAALALAALTFVVIENPIRRNRPWPFFTVRQTLAAGGAISVTVAFLAAGLQVQADLAWRRDPWLRAINAAALTIPPIPGCTFAQTFSKLAPPLRCSVGAPDAPPRILVWGDSQAHQLLPLMQVAGASGGYAVVTWSMSSCPTVVLGLPSQRGLASSCRAFNRAVAAELPALARAGLAGIVLTTIKFGFPGPQGTPEQLAAWRFGMQHVLAMAGAIKARVLVIAPIPLFSLMLPECLVHGSAAQCGGSRAMLESQRAPLLSALRELAAGYDNVRIWDPFDLFCDALTCTPMRDGMIMYRDRGHLSQSGARALAAFAVPELNWLRAQ
jgi:peptidoglycan/LPS O-acetylase OafA/YrhL